MTENTDISAPLSMATEKPDVAAKTINTANTLGVSTIDYNNSKEQFDKTLKDQMESKRTTRSVAQFMEKSPAHASAIAPERGIFEEITNYGKVTKDRIMLIFPAQTVTDLLNKKMNQNGKLSPDDQIKLDLAQGEVENYTQSGLDANGNPNNDYGFISSVPKEIIGNLGSSFYGAAQEYKIGAAISGTMGVAGAVQGALATGTPQGALALGGIGVISSIPVTTLATMGIYTFRQTSGDVYDTLSNAEKPDGSPMNIPEEEKAAISRGAGLAVAAVDLIGGKIVMNTMPFFGKLANKTFRKQAIESLVKDKAGSQIKDILKTLGRRDIIKSALGEGSTEGIQEIIQVLKEELGKTWDGKETSYLNALKNINARLGENAKRVGQAAVLGAASGGTMTATGQVAGKIFSKDSKTMPVIPQEQAPKGKPISLPKTEAILNKNIPNPVQFTKALQLQTFLMKMSKETINSELYVNSPESTYEIRANTLKDLGFTNITLNKDKLNEYANTAEKAQTVRRLLGQKNLNEASLDADIIVPMHEFVKAVDEDSKIAGLAQIDSNTLSVDDYVAAHKNAKTVADNVAAKLKTRQDAAIEKIKKANPDITDQELVTKLHDDFTSLMSEIDSAISQEVTTEDVTNEDTYYNHPIFTENIANALPQKEVAKYNDAQKSARQTRIEAIDNAAQYEMDKVIDSMTDIASEAELDQMLADHANDPNVPILEKFMEGESIFPKGLFTLEERKAPHKKQGYGPLAIDPRTLPQDLFNKYSDSEILRRRKVFVEGGVSLKTAADNLGVTPGHLLEVLENTLTKEDVKRIAKSREENIRVKAEQSVDLNDTAISKAYEDMAANHLAEMKYMKDKEWGDTKTGIKRIALDLPTLPELRDKANTWIDQTPIQDLDARQFDNGEKRSQVKAVKSILNNEVEQAFKHKENAALNSELARAARIATGQINRDLRFIKSLTSQTNQNILKAADPKYGTKIYSGSIDEIQQAFNFAKRETTNKKKQNAFTKFAKKMSDEGKGTTFIPDNILAGMDTRTSYKELTVEQLHNLADTMRNVLQQAKLKTDKLAAYNEKITKQTDDFMAAKIHNLLIEHPEYNEKRGVKSQTVTGNVERLAKAYSKAMSSLTPISYITLELDKGIHGKEMTQLIYHPLKGVGLHEGVSGESYALKLVKQLSDNYNKHIDIYGRSEFKKLGRETLNIPEFANIPELGNGKVYKIDLVMILANFGTRTNRDAIANFGVDEKTMFGILKRELTKKDFDFVQNAVWDAYESFKPKIAALEKYTDGVDTQFVDSLGFEAFGKTYKGGYHHLYYDKSYNAAVIAKETESLIDSNLGEKDTTFRPDYAARGMTKRNYLIDRQGSTKHVNLSPDTISMGFDEIAYDLAMRVPVREVMNLLKNPQVAADIIATVGPDKYKILTNTVAEASRSAFNEQTRLFADQKSWVKKTIAHFDNAFAVQALAGKLGSLMVQVQSMANVVEKMGLQSGTYHLVSTAATMFNPKNYKSFGGFFDLAKQINPDLAMYQEGFDETVHSTMSDLQPKKRVLDSTIYHKLQSGREKVNDILMGKILGAPDAMQKVIVANAAYRQFMAGESKAATGLEISKMSPQDAHTQAVAYAQHISATSLTVASKIDKAAIQKDPTIGFFVKFWNDARNNLNSNFQTNRNIKIDANKAVNYAKQGEFGMAINAYDDMGSKILTMLTVTAVSTTYASLLAGDDLPDFSDAEGVFKFFALGMSYRKLESTPIVREVTFVTKAALKGQKGFDLVRPVSVPVMKQLTDLAVSVKGISDYLLSESVNAQIKPQEAKAMFNTLGLITGAMPVAGVESAITHSEEIGMVAGGAVATGKMLFNELKEVSEYFLDTFGFSNYESVPDDQQQIIDEVMKSDIDEQVKAIFEKEKELMSGLIQETAKLNVEMNPEKVMSTPEDFNKYYEILHYAEGSSKEGVPKWNTMNADTKAFGFYQFVPKTWKGLRETHPELRLGPLYGQTEEASIKDQNKAIQAFTSDIVKTLKKAKVPATPANVYALHVLGETAGRRLFKLSDKAPLTKVMSLETMKNNPSMHTLDRTGKIKLYFNEKSTVGDYKKWTRLVIKDYGKIASKNLTQQTLK